jgi:delta24-sterol reductase
VTPRLKGEMIYQRVYQDLVMPLSALEDGLRMSDELFDIYPILVYPSRVYCGRGGVFPEPRKQDVVPGKDYAMYMDLGVYGIPKAVHANEPFDAIGSARKCEDFMTANRGAGFLYANTFYTRAEFEAAFNVGKDSLYEKVRRRTNAGEAFPHVYDKTAYRQGYKALQEEERAFWRVVAKENPGSKLDAAYSNGHSNGHSNGKH